MKFVRRVATRKFQDDVLNSLLFNVECDSALDLVSGLSQSGFQCWLFLQYASYLFALDVSLADRARNRAFDEAGEIFLIYRKRLITCLARRYNREVVRIFLAQKNLRWNVISCLSFATTVHAEACQPIIPENLYLFHKPRTSILYTTGIRVGGWWAEAHPTVYRMYSFRTFSRNSCWPLLILGSPFSRVYCSSCSKPSWRASIFLPSSASHPA